MICCRLQKEVIPLGSFEAYVDKTFDTEAQRVHLMEGDWLEFTFDIEFHHRSTGTGRF